MMTVAVLLTVYNRKEKTILCLHKLYTQLPIDGYDSKCIYDRRWIYRWYF